MGDLKNSPGPGGHSPEYTRIKTSAPIFGFGSGTRNSSGDLKINFPGPGNYPIAPLIGNEGKKNSMH